MNISATILAVNLEEYYTGLIILGVNTRALLGFERTPDEFQLKFLWFNINI